ncbi:hypothetical protein [Bradyrhizobium sp. BRP56]|uniref:hypothetical protein n=1 Tax=Bradyrhizobium sp. BRP56 TaxID=2793819 RepID=UPI001CD73F52|nr:hypothetical protein [Bradyrhizobium sp. BRP56]MCA1397227.1 hypothetical protein [Bradyrhizobium sp. BRP56]
MASTTTEPSRTPSPISLAEALAGMTLADFTRLINLIAPDPNAGVDAEDAQFLIRHCGEDIEAAVNCLDREEYTGLRHYLIRRGLMAALGGVRVLKAGRAS